MRVEAAETQAEAVEVVISEDWAFARNHFTGTLALRLCLRGARFESNEDCQGFVLRRK
ncbi:MAG: hypothetical protein ACWGON_02900 [Gemmatimonadota bacterium]